MADAIDKLLEIGLIVCVVVDRGEVVALHLLVEFQNGEKRRRELVILHCGEGLCRTQVVSLVMRESLPIVFGNAQLTPILPLQRQGHR